jgi:hypothetical protein
MRVPHSWGAVAVFTALALVGCSTSTSSVQPFWKNFGFKSKKSASETAVANAPLAPSFQVNPASSPPGNAMSANTAPTSAGNLPLYPGTNYPVTPYPANTMPAAAPAVASAATPATPAMPAAPAGAAAGFAAQPPMNAAGPGASYAPQTPVSSAYDYNAAGPSGTTMR